MEQKPTNIKEVDFGGKVNTEAQQEIENKKKDVKIQGILQDHAQAVELLKAEMNGGKTYTDNGSVLIANFKDLQGFRNQTEIKIGNIVNGTE